MTYCLEYGALIFRASDRKLPFFVLEKEQADLKFQDIVHLILKRNPPNT